MNQRIFRIVNREFELKFLKAKGSEFEALFGEIMKFTYGEDFVKTRPWGQEGDWACDGFLCSKRILYQCYAPNELGKAKTLQKMRRDLSRALLKFSGNFDTWVFVHKDDEEPPWLLTERQRLQRKHRRIKIKAFGFKELRDLVLKLPESCLVLLLGPIFEQESRVEPLQLGSDMLESVRYPFQHAIERSVFNLIVRAIDKVEIYQSLAHLLPGFAGLEGSLDLYARKMARALFELSEAPGEVYLSRFLQVAEALRDCISPYQLQRILSLVYPFCWVEPSLAEQIKDFLDGQEEENGLIWLRAWNLCELMHLHRALCHQMTKTIPVNDFSGSDEELKIHLRRCICREVGLDPGASDEKILRTIQCWSKELILVAVVRAETISPKIVREVKNNWPELVFLYYYQAIDSRHPENSVLIERVSKLAEQACLMHLRLDLAAEETAADYHAMCSLRAIGAE